MKKNKLLTVMLLILILILTTSLTLGKYVYNSVWNYYLSSRKFYFESDLLKINNRNNSLLKWSGEDIHFELRNNSNDKMVSDYDISYKITCSVLGNASEYTKCILNGTDSETYNGVLSDVSYCSAETEEEKKLNKTDCELKGFVWIDEPIKKDIYFNLKLTDTTKEIDEVSVKITAESTSPYHKTLTGIFNLNKVEKLESEYEIDYESFFDYDEITILNKANYNKCFLIEFSDEYLLDTENASIKEKQANAEGKVNKIKIEIPSESNLSYDFYKLNQEKQYSIDDFSISEKDC